MKYQLQVLFAVYSVVVISVIAWLGFYTFTMRKEMRAFNVNVVTAIQTMDGALGAIYKNNPSLFEVKKDEGEEIKK